MTWRRSRGRRGSDSSAREFVYLDEVSVTSLVAAVERDGIPETVTDKLTRASEAESSATYGAGAGKLKVGLEGRLKSSESSSREVVRRTVIQGTFDSLRRRLDPKAVQSRTVANRWYERDLGTYASASSVERDLERLVRKRVCLPIADLARGDVLEIAISLDADPVYRMLTVMTSMMEMVKGRESVLGVDPQQFQQAVPIAEMLDQLLVGLVPIRSEVRDYRLVNLCGSQHLLAADLIDPGSGLDTGAAVFEVVGLTEIGGYWKDLRRVLFGKERCTAYVRVVAPQIRTNWNPVILTEVFKSASIDIVDQVLELPRSFEAGIRGELDAGSPAAIIAWISCLTEFGNRLNVAYNSPASEADISEAVNQAILTSEDFADPEDRRRTFDVVAATVARWVGDDGVVRGEPATDVKERGQLPSPPVSFRDRVRELREDALQSLLESLGDPDETSEADAVEVEALPQLEVEFVAIYW